ncbi:unnamed protein product [Victoria cruziana]
MMEVQVDKDVELLSKAAANHLFLAQFEAFRGILLSIKKRDPGLALAILQTIVANGGEFQGVLWSKTCNSPSHLAWLSSLELARYDSPSSIWNLDPEALILMTEFLLVVQSIIYRVSDEAFPDLEAIGNRDFSEVAKNFDSGPDDLTTSSAREELCPVDAAVPLRKVLELGLRRLREAADDNYDPGGSGSKIELELSESESRCLKRIACDQAGLFDALCRNLQIQRKRAERPEDPGLAVSLVTDKRVEPVSGDELLQWGIKVFQVVQKAHLELMNEHLREGDVEKAINSIRFLHLNYGVPADEYRLLLKDLIKKVVSHKDTFFNWRIARQRKMLIIYREALSSGCSDMAQIIQSIQDELLSEEIEKCRASNSRFFPPPLQRLQDLLKASDLEDTAETKDLKNVIVKSCMRDMYQYARVSGVHVMETVVEAALSAIKKEQFEDASNVLSSFPLLQPLVASMGWDLLRGKTAARRKLMKVLWKSKSQKLRLEEFSFYGKQSEEISCVDYLCDLLCYRLDMASFAACVNSGQEWKAKYSLLLSSCESVLEENDDWQADPFVSNFVLERLAVQTPLRVLFDVVPRIKFQDAIELISMQPIASTAVAWKRMLDLELIHMKYALESVVLALGAMETSMTKEPESYKRMSFWYLQDLRNHLEAISSPPRKILMISTIISMLHMDDIAVNFAQYVLSRGYPELPCLDTWEQHPLSVLENDKEIVLSFIEHILGILKHNLPANGSEVDPNLWSSGIIAPSEQAMEWRISRSKQFIEDWEWRLSFLQQLLPSSTLCWSWKEALAILRAAPSRLLNVCLQRAKYDIGEETVHRFSLPPEDKAALDLAEWVDGASKKALVDDALSRVSEGIPSAEQELDFSSLRSQLGPIAAVLLCVDVATTSARSVELCRQLLKQARTLLSEIYPGGAPRAGLTHWDRVQEICIISVTKRALQRLTDFVEQEKPMILQKVFGGETIGPSVVETTKQGHKQRALAILDQMIEDAHKGKRQFLSGKLHNLVRALSDEEIEENPVKGDSFYTDKKARSGTHKVGVLGLGLKIMKPSSASSTASDRNSEAASYDTTDSGKRSLGHLSNKPATYLSAFIVYVANIGDIVDGIDTTHDFNFFSLVYEWPKDLLTRLVFERSNADAAVKVAEIMSADLVHKVISACVPPVYPPRFGHGWACIPLMPSSGRASLDNRSRPNVSAEGKSLIRGSSATSPVTPAYPLQLSVVKHLATLSPVRAVLACVFGSSILSSGSISLESKSSNDSITETADNDRLFYEFALDQSYRFPTLNRWIQMQSNLHRVSESAATSRCIAEAGKTKAESRFAIKRPFEPDSDTESEEEDKGRVVVGSNMSIAVSESDAQNHGPSESLQSKQKFENMDLEKAVFVSLDWENEGPYEEAVERLIGEGKYMDALALSDRCLRDGASDRLLQLLVEGGEENHLATDLPLGYGIHSVWSNSWQYCLRFKDKQLAARLALKYLHRWELNAAMDVLTMCICHLPEGDPLRSEAILARQALRRYSHILHADDRYNSWQEVEADCKEDPEDLRRELQGRQLVKLLTADPVSGGGPAEASRFLSSFHEANDALPVAMGAMQQLPNLRSKQLLVHFFLKRRDGNMSDAEISQLNAWALGLRVLATLPLPWQQRCSALHEHPLLILEVLLMCKQLESASQVMKEFPSLRDNNLILVYAAKAIAVNMNPSVSERRAPVVVPRTKQKTQTGMPAKSNFSNSLSNLQKEARRAFSWAPRDSGTKANSKEPYRKRKSSGLSPSENTSWEAMASIQEDHSSNALDGQERFPSIATSERWVLTGDKNKDEAIRVSHRYESAPDITLFKALLSLCADETVSAKGALELCITQMKNVLSSQQLPLNASMETVGRAYRATETFVQALIHSKAQLKKLVGSSEASSNSDKSKEADEVSSDAGSSSVSSQCTDELPELVAQADIWLGRAELLQSLLGSGIVASLDDIADQESSSHLRDRLIKDERYSMAVYTCKKCKIDAFRVWNAWGHALIRMERYAQARVKFKQALQLHKGDPTAVVIDIINTIESGPPVDVSAVRSMYEHLARSAPTILDDSLSADAYLSVLHISTFPRSERSRRSQLVTSHPDVSTSLEDSDDGPRSNLDNARYTECVNYLQEYAKQEMLDFMFRHGRYAEACSLFFPPNAVPPPPQPSHHAAVTPTASPQRPDALATDYGTIDDLCDLCVGYGAMSILEHVLAARSEAAASQNVAVIEHTSLALNRICTYCETHKHFNFLYKFQVLKKDHVAAGLCCIQLFMNSCAQEEATKHLENAKLHFEEGLSARHRAGESIKLLSKSMRGKSASVKLSEEDLVKFSSRVTIQVNVVKSFNDNDGPPWKHSLFGNPNDPETFRRRCEVAETLAEKNFDLAFQVIYEFNLPAVDIYAAVAKTLAERKKGNQLTEFLRNIKGTIDDSDWDQVLLAAIVIYANKHRERPDRLIDMLKSVHRKVIACVICGRLKTAFQIASRNGSTADVDYVAHQALLSNALPVVDMCRQWFDRYL